MSLVYRCLYGEPSSPRWSPLREGLLTVNKAWLGGTGDEAWHPERVAAFRTAALAFLKENLPEGQLRYASGHGDEEAYHIHFVVAVWHERVTVNRGRQFLLQPSLNPLLANYEHAQTIAGEAFAHLGITRGERRAEAQRAAKAAGEPVPETPQHIPPSKWRARQRELAQRDANRITNAAAERADTIIEDGRTLARTTMRKSRKRAIKEARVRKEKAAREVADQARRKDALAREAAQTRRAADAAQQEKAAAEATIIALAHKTTAYLDRAKAAEEQWRAVKAACALEDRNLQNVRAAHAQADTARRQVQEETAAEIITKDQAEAKARDARTSLMRTQTLASQAQAVAVAAEDQVALAKEQRKTEEEAMAQTTKRRKAEEARLESSRAEVAAAEARATDIERMVDTVEAGIDLIADSALRWTDDPPDEPRLIWGRGAPEDATERRQLLKRFRPAGSLIQRIAQMVAHTVRHVLATERQQLAEDAAYVAALRQDWDAEQQAKLDELSGNSGPDYG